MKSKNGLIYLLIAGELVLLVLILVLGMINRVKSPGTPKDDMTAMENIENQMNPSAAEEYSQWAENGQPQEGQGAAGEEPVEPEGTVGDENGSLPDEADGDANSSSPDEIQREIFSDEVEALLAQMNTEQKVAQVFLVTPETLTNTDQVTVASGGTRTALQNYPVGGLLYGSGNFMGVAQIRELITRAQAMSLEYSGQYLFAAMTVEQEDGAFLGAARIGQEEQMGALLNPQTAQDPAMVAELIRLPLYRDLEQLAAGEQEAGVKCFSIGPEGPGAVEALQNGADMVCVTEGFAEAYQSVLAAVQAQELSEITLDEAVGHILTKKQEISEQAAGNET